METADDGSDLEGPGISSEERGAETEGGIPRIVDWRGGPEPEGGEDCT